MVPAFTCYRISIFFLSFSCAWYSGKRENLKISRVRVRLAPVDYASPPQAFGNLIRERVWAEPSSLELGIRWHAVLRALRAWPRGGLH